MNKVIKHIATGEQIKELSPIAYIDSDAEETPHLFTEEVVDAWVEYFDQQTGEAHESVNGGMVGMMGGVATGTLPPPTQHPHA